MEHVTDMDVAEFLTTKLSIGQKLTINLNNILGVGGEAVVVKDNSGDYAFKVIPFDDKENEESENESVEMIVTSKSTLGYKKQARFIITPQVLRPTTPIFLKIRTVVIIKALSCHAWAIL